MVSAVGMSSEAVQQEATMTAVALVRPSWAAWSFSQAAAQIAPRIRPGSTNGTRRRLAHGWSGATAGRYSTVTIDQSAIISGSAQTRAAAWGLPSRQRSCAALGQDGQAERAEQHGGHADVPDHPVQAVLVVLLPAVDGQAGQFLQLGHVGDRGRDGLPRHVCTSGLTAKPTKIRAVRTAAAAGSQQAALVSRLR